MPRARIAYNSLVTKVEKRDPDWWITIVLGGIDFSFCFGPAAPEHLAKNTPISVILEYQVPEC